MRGEGAKGSFGVGGGDTTPRDRRNSAVVVAAFAAHAVAFAAALRVLRSGLLSGGALPWVVAAVPVLVLLVAFRAYATYLRQADELQRAIQLRALAFGFGGGWLAILGYPLFVRLGAPALAAQDYAVVMAVFYMLGVVLGQRRYR